MKQGGACLAIIADHGASAGLPEGGATWLAGAPLLAHAIAAARGARQVSRVVVSTSDSRVAHLAHDAGVEVVAPSAALADVSARVERVAHVLATLRERDGYWPELTMLLDCMRPLLVPGDLDALVDTLRTAGADSAFTSTAVGSPLWLRGPEDAATLFPAAAGPSAAGPAALVLENGAAYLMRSDAFDAARNVPCGRVASHAMDPTRALAVRDALQLAQAEGVVRAQRTRALADALPQDLRAVIFDFDGVMTDNRVFVDESGRETVACDRGDGMGLGLVRDLGIELLILSKEQNPVVSARARKLKLPCLQGIDDKPTSLLAWLQERGIGMEQAAYVGNDVNDVGCMRLVGCAVAPSDAHPSALAVATVVLGKAGGRGAVRELCDAILERRARAGQTKS